MAGTDVAQRVMAGVYGAFAEYADEAKEFPWHFVNSIDVRMAENPTIVAGEAIFIAVALLGLVHAVRTKHVTVWLATIAGGIFCDEFFKLCQLAGNFWQGQALVMLGPRLGIYILAVYNAFVYIPYITSERLSSTLSNVTKSALAGLLAGLFYAPFDMVGVKYLWWTWHNTDAGVRARWLYVPYGSTCFTIAFTAAFTLLTRWFLEPPANTSRKRRRLSASARAVGFAIVTIASTPLMMALMGVAQLIGTDEPGLVTHKALSVLVALPFVTMTKDLLEGELVLDSDYTVPSHSTTPVTAKTTDSSAPKRSVSKTDLTKRKRADVTETTDSSSASSADLTSTTTNATVITSAPKPKSSPDTSPQSTATKSPTKAPKRSPRSKDGRKLKRTKSSPSLTKMKARATVARQPLIAFTVVLYFIALCYTGMTGEPETHVARGLHQTLGACDVTERDMMGFERNVYLCPTNHREPFTICTEKDGAWHESNAEGVSYENIQDRWYSLCGTPHGELWELWWKSMVFISSLGSVVFTWLLLQEQEIESRKTRRRTRKSKQE
eukprot:GFYU01010171.1.p1 GENE.GFYU01010171.1~~GFYU01010171.1.p1  ORF type:complete len:552 (-),score=95.86 GFYU01010171.1:40-1695(-)